MIPSFAIVTSQDKPQCSRKMPHRRPVLGNRRARLMNAGFDPDACFNHAWALIGGRPYCKTCAKEVALDLIMDNQEKTSG